MNRIKTVFIVGPTASGKTDLSIKIAKRFDGEIISADSMQIYKGIHIASAAPDNDEMQGIKHHFIEFLDTDKQFSVADYVKSARSVIKEIAENGKLPIVVGGTGLYVSSLLDNTDYLEEETDLDLRKELEDEFSKIGGEEMLKKLSEFDADSAARLHPNNKRRIIRAFEVYKLTGKTITEQNLLSHNGDELLDSLVLGITYNDREKLYERINRRVDIMLSNGLLEEVQKTYLERNKSGGFQAIGHKELYPYLDGEISLEEAVENLKRQTRRYAKRQLTWFRRDNRINWLTADGDDDNFAISADIINEFLRR